MKHPALKITLIYLVLGMLWIFLSDRVVKLLVSGEDNIILVQQAKGAFYIIGTALLLYALIRKFYSRQESIKKEYERIFSDFGHPMWVYDQQTLEIIATNKCAIAQYSYSRSEFSKMKITDLHSDATLLSFLRPFDYSSQSSSNSGFSKHRKKFGRDFFVEIFGIGITYKNRSARLILAVDMNDMITARQRILEQNGQLKQIAQLQAHEIRGPLATIMGLISVFDYLGTDASQSGLIIEKLNAATGELDQVIKEIIYTSEQTDDTFVETP